MPNNEVHRRANDLLDTRTKIFNELSQSGQLEDMARAMRSDRYVAAGKAADEFIFVPHLIFDIQPSEVSSGCVGSVNAELSADLEQANMLYRTRTTVYRPHVQIRSHTYVVAGPQRAFTDQVTNVAEELMKQLLNDWSASQDLQ